MNRHPLTLLLVLATVICGWTFSVVQDAIEAYCVLGFLTVRFPGAVQESGSVLWAAFAVSLGDAPRNGLRGPQPLIPSVTIKPDKPWATRSDSAVHSTASR